MAPWRLLLGSRGLAFRVPSGVARSRTRVCSAETRLTPRLTESTENEKGERLKQQYWAKFLWAETSTKKFLDQHLG